METRRKPPTEPTRRSTKEFQRKSTLESRSPNKGRKPLPRYQSGKRALQELVSNRSIKSTDWSSQQFYAVYSSCCLRGNPFESTVSSLLSKCNSQPLPNQSLYKSVNHSVFQDGRYSILLLPHPTPILTPRQHPVSRHGIKSGFKSTSHIFSDLRTRTTTVAVCVNIPFFQHQTRYLLY